MIFLIIPFLGAKLIKFTADFRMRESTFIISFNASAILEKFADLRFILLYLNSFRIGNCFGIGNYFTN